MSYITYLKLVGYRGFIDKPIDNTIHNITISEENINDNIKKAQIKWYEKQQIRIIINSIYPIFIVLILMWIPLYTIIQAILLKNIQIVTQNFFSFLFLIQFILSMEYYSTDHIDKTHNGAINSNILNKYYTNGIIISFVLSIFFLLLIINKFDVEIYTKIYSEASITQKILISIVLLLEKMYTYSTFSINIINFTFIFSEHSKNVELFGINFEKKMNNSEIIDVHTIISEYQELKDKYGESVVKWNSIFSSLILFGIIGIYFIVINYQLIQYVGPTQYVNAIYFISIDALYLLIINKVKVSTSTILKIINSSQFINNYHNNSIMDEIKGNINTMDKFNDSNNLNNDHKSIAHLQNMIFRIMIKSHENSFSNEWMILSRKLSQEWEYFSVFGFELKDISLIKKAIVILVAFFMASHLRYQLEI